MSAGVKVLADAIVDAPVTVAATAADVGTAVETTPSPLLGATPALVAIGKATLVGSATHQDKHYNALFKEGRLGSIKDGETALWRYRVGEATSTVSVGFSREGIYKPGYGCSGLWVNSVGNLCGRGMITGQFVPKIGSGTLVDIFIQRVGSSLVLTYAVDSKCTGARATLEFQDDVDATLASIIPAIAFSEQARAEVSVSLFAPVTVPADAPFTVRDDTNLASPEGQWSTEAPHPMKLSIAEGSRKVTGIVRNTFVTGSVLQQDGTITAPGAIATTRMLGPPFEREVGDWLQTLGTLTWALSDGGRTLTIGDRKFTRNDPTVTNLDVSRNPLLA